MPEQGGKLLIRSKHGDSFRSHRERLDLGDFGAMKTPSAFCLIVSKATFHDCSATDLLALCAAQF